MRLVRTALVACIAVACRSPHHASPGRAPLPSQDSGPLVAFLGDSLTAGYGIPQEQAYPALIERRLRADGYALRVINAGVSGETTADGLRRLGNVLERRPAIVVVAMGANDGMRGQDLDAMEANLRAILAAVRASGAKPLLVGMRIGPEHSAGYGRRFEAVFPRLAKEQRVPLVPFLLEGVADRPELLLPDGIHPTADGHRRLAWTVLPYVWELVAQAQPKVPARSATP